MLSVPLRSYALILTLLTSCGNPVTLQKDLKSEEGKRKSAEQTSADLTTKVTLLKSFLTHIYVSTNNLWVFAGLSSSFDAAKAQCTDIGYTLPASYAVEEFKDDILPAHPEWSKYMDQLQVEGKSSPPDSGVVLCRIAKR